MKWGDDTQPMYGPNSDPTKPRGIGQFYLVARADAAVTQEEFESELRRLSERVRSLPPLVNGGPAPQVAGDPEIERAAWRSTHGIPLDQVVTDGLQALSSAHRVPLQLTRPIEGVVYELRV